MELQGDIVIIYNIIIEIFSKNDQYIIMENVIYQYYITFFHNIIRYSVIGVNGVTFA